MKMKLSKMSLEQVKKQIVFKEQKIKSLFEQVVILNKRESQLIAESNLCCIFNPLPTIFGLSMHCRDCSQLEAAHKGHEPVISSAWENTSF